MGFSYFSAIYLARYTVALYRRGGLRRRCCGSYPHTWAFTALFYLFEPAAARFGIRRGVVTLARTAGMTYVLYRWMPLLASSDRKGR